MKVAEKIAAWWCRTVHDEINWPSHGDYTCRSCGRYFRVRWGEGEGRERHLSMIVCARQSRGGSLARPCLPRGFTHACRKNTLLAGLIRAMIRGGADGQA